jgi:hypothetical protein
MITVSLLYCEHGVFVFFLKTLGGFPAGSIVPDFSALKDNLQQISY